MSDETGTMTICGIEIPIKAWSMEIDGPLAYKREHSLPDIDFGVHTVTGTLEVRFENTALLEEYCRRDVELDAFLRSVLFKQHKADAWTTALPYLRRFAIVTFVIAASLLFATGAA